MVMQALLLLPWVICTIALLVIIVFFKNKNDLIDEDNMHSIKVAIIDGKAYWVFDNVFYETNIDEDGEPMFDDATPIDTMLLSDFEVTRLLYILDSLNEK